MLVRLRGRFCELLGMFIHLVTMGWDPFDGRRQSRRWMMRSTVLQMLPTPKPLICKHPVP